MQAMNTICKNKETDYFVFVSGNDGSTAEMLKEIGIQLYRV
jgi:hypothetical protein